MTPLEKAREAANQAFDEYLARNHWTACSYVPDHVVAAAQRAYVEAGGNGEIEVVGRGNVTHPVCSVDVVLAKRRS